MSINHTRTLVGGGNNTVKKERTSNLELYRIIVMLMIVAHHYLVLSGLYTGPVSEDPLSRNSIFYCLFGMWGKTGINCFLMITGYFMCSSNISLRKFLKLYLWIVTYNIIIFVLLLVTGRESFSLNLINLLFPFCTIHSHNFVSSFMVWWLFIPFLNVLVNNMSRKHHLALMVLLITVFSIYPTIPKILNIDSNPICWFSTIYMIASYIRKYPSYVYKENSSAFWGWISALLIFIAMVSVVAIIWLGVRIKHVLPFYFFVSDSCAPLALLISVSTFLFFKNLNIRYNKYVNLIGASSFGVLLIHSNSRAMMDWLWKDTLDCVGHYDTPFYWLYAIGCVCAIYAVCTIIDIIRIKTIETPIINATERLCMSIYNKFNKK